MRTGVYEDIFFNLLRSAIVENFVKNHGKMRVTVTCDVFLFLLISHIYPQAKSVYDNQFNGVFKYKRKLQLVCEERTNSRIRFHKLHEVYNISDRKGFPLHAKVLSWELEVNVANQVENSLSYLVSKVLWQFNLTKLIDYQIEINVSE